ncbi:MAG: T9SS type A sorting domain-containing protein [Bacteroidetes bacterium]|jgi:hypothetical protein|nr:T9SS type A sorting domain-containing protein [Bacteroidota bacterium]MBT7144273.1 T9SS type A sorting domain-containing protein [Bacteroidota bacterium]MBT7492937.1 T9SS type A sorting domain-containing protein [Bacteroidota bacterium]
MKKYFLIFISILFLLIKGEAQNIELYHENLLITSDTIIVFGNVSADTLHTYIFQGDTTYYYSYEAFVEIDIKNISTNNINVQCKKRHIQLIPNTQNYFCWSSCFPPYTFESTIPVTIPSNETIDIFSGHYKPNGKLGCILVAYTFYNNDNPSDSAMALVKFIMDFCNPTSIAKVNKNQKQFSQPYPNPATSYFFIDKLSKSMSNQIISIYDSMGKLISIQSIDNVNSRLKVNTNYLKRGYYFYKISNNIVVNNSGIIIIK